jgi:hypothetical protein
MQGKNLTYREFTSTLIKFLKEHDALENYKRNCINYITLKNTIVEFVNPLQTKIMDDTLEKGDLNGVFWYAFCWADSPQGDRYWRTMASEWDKLIKDVKLCKEKI